MVDVASGRGPLRVLSQAGERSLPSHTPVGRSGRRGFMGTGTGGHVRQLLEGADGFR